jgi:hypothetical protein
VLGGGWLSRYGRIAWPFVVFLTIVAAAKAKKLGLGGPTSQHAHTGTRRAGRLEKTTSIHSVAHMQVPSSILEIFRTVALWYLYRQGCQGEE